MVEGMDGRRRLARFWWRVSQRRGSTEPTNCPRQRTNRRRANRRSPNCVPNSICASPPCFEASRAVASPSRFSCRPASLNSLCCCLSARSQGLTISRCSTQISNRERRPMPPPRFETSSRRFERRSTSGAFRADVPTRGQARRRRLAHVPGACEVAGQPTARAIPDRPAMGLRHPPCCDIMRARWPRGSLPTSSDGHVWAPGTFAELDDERAAIIKAFPELNAAPARATRARTVRPNVKESDEGSRPARRTRRKMSAAARKRISDAQKKRWAAQKAGKN